MGGVESLEKEQCQFTVQKKGTIRKTAGAATDYCCIHCMGPLSGDDPAELCCQACGRAFPVISDIPVLTVRPRELLMVHLQELGHALAALEQRRALSAGASGGTAPGTAERIRRMLDGMTRNFRLIERFAKPIEDYLHRTRDRSSNLIDWALAQNVGSAPQTMLPFFYQDWARTRDFENAESLIVGALREHSPDRGAAAILGAGACGIVYASAMHFRVVYGLDLSVPTLLIAQAVLSGHPIEIAVAHAGWHPVQLTPPAPAKNKILLLAADVGTLPFAEESLSAVVTQYMMDIAGDPLGVATEIQRVLRPGGIWVNFSNPFKLPGDPPELGLPEPSELPGLFQPLGLEMVKVQRTRFTLQNLDQIYAGGHRNAQEVHFFVARKVAQPRETAVRKGFRMWDRHDLDSWWERVPAIIPGREIQIIRKRVFGPRNPEDRVEIGMNAVSFVVSPEHTAFVEALFGQIDGKHTLRAILDGLISQGMPLSEMEFRELIHCLLNQYCVMSLNDSIGSPGQ
jgi:SAM-dependent methyltransferase